MVTTPTTTDSVLTLTKRTLGIDEEYTAFDIEIITHINSVFSTLHQLGIGTKDPYFIEDKTKTWSGFMEDNNAIHSVKSLMFAEVKLLFDPPTTSYLIDSLRKLSDELKWRLRIQGEQYQNGT